MPINTETLNSKLYHLLSKYDPKPLDVDGKVTPLEDEADVFKFEFTKDGKSYGDVFATVDDDRKIVLYYKDDVTQSPDSPTPGIGYDDTWWGFLEQLAKWWPREGFSGRVLKNTDKLGSDMARRKHMKNKDHLGEGYYPMGKRASYSDAVPSVKIVIEHSRVIEEGEQRYRNINRIFLENQLGERYLLDTKKPGIARVYARHIAEGGKVNDDRWNHIGSLCEEYQKMAGFVRATRNGQFNESAQSLVNEGIAHYESLRESLSRLTGKRGYNAYFESWTPALMETEGEESNLNELFVQETLDPRIESVMPILSRIHKKVSESVIDKELNKLAEWADSLSEAEGESIQSNNPVGIPESEDHSPVSNAITRRILMQHPDLLKKFGPVAVTQAIDDIADSVGDVEEIGSSDVSGWVKQVAQSLGGHEGQLDEIDVDALNQLASHAVNTLGHGGAGLAAAAGGAGIGGAIAGAGKKAIDWYQKRKEEKALAKQKGVAEDLDANQKRVGQLGPTEPVGKNEKNLRGKLVGANENFINQADQAVTTEDDEMAEGVLDAIKRGVGNVKQGVQAGKDEFKKAWDEEWPKIKQDWQHPIQSAMAKEGEMDEGAHTQHYHDANTFTGDVDHGERPPTDWSTDPIEAGTDRIHQKISSVLKKLSKPKDKQELDEVDTGEYDARKSTHKGETTPEQEKEFRKKVQAYGDELEQRQKEKDNVKEGQEDFDAILRIIRK